MTVAAFCDHLVGELEAKILAVGPENVAAFFAELVLGAGGVIVPPDDYNRRTRELCRRYDVLYLADEVVTGFGRSAICSPRRTSSASNPTSWPAPRA